MIALKPSRDDSLEWVDHPWFHTVDALARIAALCPGQHADLEQACQRAAAQLTPPSAAAIAKLSRTCSSSTRSNRNGARAGGSAAIRQLCRREPLTRAAEQYLFARMNYEKSRVAVWSEDAGQLERAEVHQRVAIVCRDLLVEANLRLVTSIAQRFATASRPLEDLVSEATVPLMRAVDLFDFQRGYCFSTYATHTVWNYFSRSLRRIARQQKLGTGVDADLLAQTVDESEHPAILEQQSREMRQQARELLGTLNGRQREIVELRFGLDHSGQPRTYQAIGEQCGLSKERVRVITNQALEAMRQHAVDCEFSLA